MTKRWTKTNAFAEFNAVCANFRWSWSGRSPDGSVVVLTFWEDRFTDLNVRPVIYDDRGWGGNVERVAKLGNKQRMKDIAFAISSLEGLVQVVITRAKDVSVRPRQIECCWPEPALVMKITDFNAATGEWIAESVHGDEGR